MTPIQFDDTIECSNCHKKISAHDRKEKLDCMIKICEVDLS